MGKHISSDALIFYYRFTCCRSAPCPQPHKSDISKGTESMGIQAMRWDDISELAVSVGSLLPPGQEDDGDSDSKPQHPANTFDGQIMHI